MYEEMRENFTETQDLSHSVFQKKRLDMGKTTEFSPLELGAS